MDYKELWIAGLEELQNFRTELLKIATESDPLTKSTTSNMITAVDAIKIRLLMLEVDRLRENKDA